MRPTLFRLLFASSSLWRSCARGRRRSRGVELHVCRNQEISSVCRWGWCRAGCWVRRGCECRAVAFLVAEARGFEECLAWCVGGFVQRCWYAVEGAESKDAAESAVASPAAVWCDGDQACDVIFVVVHVETEWSVQELRRICQWSVESLIHTTMYSRLRQSRPARSRLS